MHALVDDEEFDRLNLFSWYALKTKAGYYAARNAKDVNNKTYLVLMHRNILGLSKGDGVQVDHINHNTLDDRLVNIRKCTRSENQWNTLSKTGTSEYKGVAWEKRTKKWYAYIKINRKNKYLGRYDSEIKAARVYDLAAQKHFGEFACLNFSKKEVA